MVQVTKSCEKCGAPFSGPAWQVRRQRYCGRGCFSEAQKLDLSGRRFGRLVARRYQPPGKWLCDCDCGRTATPTIANLQLGRATSCGCRQKELAAAKKLTHGQHKSRTYVSWAAMLKRCRKETDPRFPAYGAKGIDYDPRWENFEAFWADMGDRPEGTSIDRIDGSKGYWPGNCRWATIKEQQRNTKSNAMITHDGLTLCVAEWAERLGINRNTIYHRLWRGLTPAQVLSKTDYRRT